jgi:dTDP-4-amino-4,6-dideoxygalactose transaminase
MTDIQAAVGREQLKRLPEILEQRRALAVRYAELLNDVPGLSLPTEREGIRTNWQSYCVRLPTGSDQRKVMQLMLDQQVSTRRGIMCSHREPAYSGDALRYRLQESESAQDTCVLLPLFPGMKEDEQQRVIAALRTALAKFGATTV